MKSAKSWRAFLFFFLLIGIDLPMIAYSGVELKMKESEVKISLYFPYFFVEDKQIFSTFIYHIILSRIPVNLHHLITSEQEGNTLYFVGTNEVIDILQVELENVISKGVQEEEFLEQKERLLESQYIMRDDLNRWIKMSSCVRSPTDVFPNQDVLSFSQIDLDMTTPRLILVEGEETSHFYALRRTMDDCHNISKLIKNMADLSLWELLKRIKEMKKLGQKIEPVHPLRFLGYIFSTHELKKRIPKIKDSYFKWSRFTEGLFARLTKEAQHNNLNRFIPGFIREVGCSEVVIEDYVRRHDWIGMLHYLMS